MIITESRYRVLVKVPYGINALAYTNELFLGCTLEIDIEEIERSPCFDGSTDVTIYPKQDTSIHCARMLEKLTRDVAAELGFILVPTAR